MYNKTTKALSVNNAKTGTSYAKGVITPRHEKSIILYFNEIGKMEFNPVLTKSEEKNLYKMMKEGDVKAKERLINTNLRFVVSVAKMYVNQGLPFEDLVSEGNHGLIKALDRFDPELNIKFYSYAVWWIRQSILQALTEIGKMIRLPNNKKDSLTKVNIIVQRLEQELERKPSINEIVDQTDNLTSKNVNDILRSNLTQTSFDAPLSNRFGGEDGSLYDILPAEALSYNTRSLELTTEIQEVLGKLSDIEGDIVKKFFGILGNKKNTLEEIGLEYGKTRERIRQIKENALRKLRNNPKIKDLFEHSIDE